MVLIREVLKTAKNELSDVSETPALDAEILLGNVLDKPRSYLHVHGDDKLTQEQHNDFHRLIERRLAGEPIAYLLGVKEFWSLALDVNPEVLIPRPDTELIVEVVLQQFVESGLKMLDLGTGSGAIALAVASERPDWDIYATDVSFKAIELANSNAEKLGINNVSFIESDWFAAIPDMKFDIIVSNPPYIAASDPELSVTTAFEPKRALISGDNGLADIKIIIAESYDRLNESGMLLLEHGFKQGEDVRELLQQHGYQDIKTYQDLAGHDRVTVGITPTKIKCA